VDGIPTASIAMLDDGEISAHVITNGKENSETVYQACSISKAITALAVAKLVDQGLLSYETKVLNHLAQSTVDCLVDSKTSHLMKHITVGMLLSHISGLSQGG
jgi:CubicO group peptidase (beta-lactamase class C family)